MKKVDINCDMGESFGTYQIGQDEEILDYVTSANIACGFHAGDPSIMRKTVQLAIEKNTGIGVHPGLPDLAGFGRRFIDITPQEAYDMVVYQIGALQSFVQAEGGSLQHVKPHGALYNRASKQKDLAEAIAEAVYKVDPALILFGLAGSELVKAGRKTGLITASEVFADRTYQSDGSLTSRREPDALITDQEQAVNQVIKMVKEKKVHTLQNEEIGIEADTICIHGDGAHALEFANYINSALKESGIEAAKISNVLND
ncbi:LamB/YcsF family protein [Halobacillus salinarum]|uniref:5-oxoprolinase subunit A n=1 Tax=Halobacillus salinarum TaxID=2932257 RepID=A0ABY4EHD2_9BACI|nr:5-oxoprolinase subunit PxpA [Halobacillus salinarum]UOQ43869.1 LamB/YcsF family protein [Halobacillus salinarum]